VVSAAAAAARAVWQHIDQHRSDYLPNSSPYEVDWIVQNGKVVEQAVNLLTGGSAYRDSCMAANFDWILQHAAPGAKAVIWAHDYHVSRWSGAMGSYLGNTHGKDYLVVGQFFHAGRYNAWGSSGVKPYDAVPSFPGSAEYIFHSTGMPRFILDMRKASYDDPVSAWMRNEIQYRTIGAVPADGFSMTARLARDYDALVFFDQTTPSALLPF
jgi:erythromycin esterase